MKKAAFFCNNPSTIDWVYGAGRKERVAQIVDLYPEIITVNNFAEHVENLEDIEVIFSTWGMLQLTDEELDKLPSLRAVFYAAGSVQCFARPFLRRGITVISAWGANAVPVAEFTLAQILLATKGYFRNTQDCRSPEKRIKGDVFTGKGNFGETIAVLGAGMIGKTLIRLLKDFNLKIIVYDPFLSQEEAEEMGVEKVSLEEAFCRGYVVTNHIADLPATKRMLTGELFEKMRENATFINTGRGATVAEDEMIQVLKKRPDITALLDVTDPEPPVATSELYQLPNVHLSSHIAGSLGDEVVRMADYCIEEFLAWQEGKPLKYAVTLEMLETMA